MNEFQRMNEKLLCDPLRIIKVLLPFGRRESNEWISLNPTRNDQSIGSFKVNIRTGKWADFATGDKGGDIISLYAYLNRCSQFEALQSLTKIYDK